MHGVSFVALAGCLLALMLALRLLLKTQENRLAAYYLAGFLVGTSAFVLDSLAYREAWFESLPHLFALANPLQLASLPCFYLYLRTLTAPERPWHWQNLGHFLPSLLATLVDIPVYVASAEVKRQLFRDQLAEASATLHGSLVYLVINGYALTYLALTWRCFLQGQKHLHQNEEEGRSHHPRGLRGFLLLVSASIFISAVLDFTPYRFEGSLTLALTLVTGFFSAFWLMADNHGFLLSTRKNNLRDQTQALTLPLGAGEGLEPQKLTPLDKPPRFDLVEAPPPSPAPLRPEELERLGKRLRQLFNEDKVYLEADLTLLTLAERAGCTRHKLSAALREAFGGTFYQIIARKRVEEAARLLSSREGRARTIADIAFGVGFNTLSAFNSAFKDCYGTTPSRYRQERAPKTPAA